MNLSELLSEYGLQYFLAYLTTLELTILAFAGAFVFGILITVLRICPIKPLRKFGEFYVQIFRNIPGAALLILLVYALPYLNILFSYYTCVVIAIMLIPSSFLSEYLISGIQTIDIGQLEAARSLGMSFLQIISKIIIPQALRAIILQLTNLLVLIMLTTSLASQVPMDPRELTGLVTYINTYSTAGLVAFVVSAFLYCITAILIGVFGNKLDKKLRIPR